MITLIETEFLKLKRSKTFYLVLLGAVAPAILMFIALLYIKFSNSHPVIMSEFYDMIIQTSVWFFNIILYSLVGGYIIANEYNNHTIKSIITAPISRTRFVIGKWITFELIVILLAVLSFAFSTVFGYVGGALEITSNVVGEAFNSYLTGSILLSLPMSIFLFLGFLFKNPTAPVIIGVVIGFSNTLLMGREFAALTPYLSPYLYLTGQLGKGVFASYGVVTPWAILVTVALLGVVLSLIYFKKADISL